MNFTLTYSDVSLCLVGLHLIEVLYDEVAVPKSPFKVSVTEGCDPTRVRAYGPGLEEGLVNKPNRFTVETRWFITWLDSVLELNVSDNFALNSVRSYFRPSLLRGAGTGGLGLAIEGPSEAKMSCKDNKDGSCSVEYIPFTPGEYDVNITFGGLPIPGAGSKPSDHNKSWQTIIHNKQKTNKPNIQGSDL